MEDLNKSHSVILFRVIHACLCLSYACLCMCAKQGSQNTLHMYFMFLYGTELKIFFRLILLYLGCFPQTVFTVYLSFLLVLCCVFLSLVFIFLIVISIFPPAFPFKASISLQLPALKLGFKLCCLLKRRYPWFRGLDQGFTRYHLLQCGDQKPHGP